MEWLKSLMDIARAPTMARNTETELLLATESPPAIQHPRLREIYENAWKDGYGHIAEQVMQTDLADGQKINVIYMWDAQAKKDATIDFYRRVTQVLFILQASTGAIVPILIPFGQTYNGQEKHLFGWQISNFGEVILVVAVICSLLGSISMVVERAGKFSKLAFAYNNEQELRICTLLRFLALGGSYKQYSSHSEAYPVFVNDMAVTLLMNSRAKIFGSVVDTGAGAADENKDTKTDVPKSEK